MSVNAAKAKLVIAYAAGVPVYNVMFLSEASEIGVLKKWCKVKISIHIVIFEVRLY